MTAWTRRLVPALALAAVVLAAGACRSREPNPSPAESGASRTARRVDAALAPDAAAAAPQRPGLAAAILIDTSGSMNRTTRDSGDQTKIAVARRAAMDLVDQFARYAADHKDEPVQLAIYEFSSRDGREDVRAVVPMGPPDRDRAEAAIFGMLAEGGTPIGDAMVVGKRALDATGLARRHLLVVTDGENTDGLNPADVTAGIGRRPVDERPSIYFVAFDIAASRFNRVKDAGGLVLGAATGKELGDTLDSLLRGRILVEK
jgi:Mg-chelatase subunit ChlD